MTEKDRTTAETVAINSKIRPIGHIGFGEKVGFGLGDFACNLVYASLSSYLLFFYTNVFGLSAGAAGLIFFVVRIIDAVSDPVIGFFVDKTNTKYGKYRPFLLWGAIPFALLAVLCFTVPSFGGQLN